MGELGTRYKCYKCSFKFYDLNRPQPLCPSCGEDQNDGVIKPMTKKKNRRSFFLAKKANSISAPEENNDLMEIDNKESESGPDLDPEDIVIEEDTEMDDPDI